MSDYVKVCIKNRDEIIAKIIPVSALYAVIWSRGFRNRDMYALKCLLRVLECPGTLSPQHTPVDAGLVYANFIHDEVVYCLADGVENVIDAVPFESLLAEIKGKTFVEPKKLDEKMRKKLGDTFSRANLFDQMFAAGVLEGGEYLNEFGTTYLDTGLRLSMKTTSGQSYAVANSYSNNPPIRYPFTLPFRVHHVDPTDENLIHKVAKLSGIPAEHMDDRGFEFFLKQHEGIQKRRDAERPRLSEEVLWGSLNLAI